MSVHLALRVRSHRRPSPYLVKRLKDERLLLASELEREPMAVRCGKLGAVTFLVCMTILGVVFAVQLVWP